MTAKWLGNQTRCEVCGRYLSTTEYFVDGKTKNGPWAIMCPDCYDEIGCGVGIGKGQIYNSKTREKIE